MSFIDVYEGEEWKTVTTWAETPVVGQRVSYSTTAHRSDGTVDWAATGGGIYLGVLRSEEDGIPMHYFVNGYINDGPQLCHGFPAPADAEITDERTPTDAITAALA